MNLLELSKTIRELRKKQGMTVETLARQSGFSKGFISQIENFRITPSLKALMKISSALGVSLEEIFSGNVQPARPYSFGNLSEGEPFDRDAGENYGIHYLALAHRQIGRKMDPFVIEYTPGPERDFLLHDTEEFFILLEGELEYCIYDNNTRKHLVPGDTVYMQANVPHRVILPENCPRARALVIYSDLPEL